MSGKGEIYQIKYGMLRRYVVTFKCLRASLRKILQSEASADVHRHMEENSILACEISDVRTPRANNVIVPGDHAIRKSRFHPFRMQRPSLIDRSGRVLADRLLTKRASDPIPEIPRSRINKSNATAQHSAKTIWILKCRKVDLPLQQPRPMAPQAPTHRRRLPPPIRLRGKTCRSLSKQKMATSKFYPM